MHGIDWAIVVVAFGVIAWIAIYTQRYVKGVSDFLSAGRVAGRYVLCVSGAEAGFGLISLVAIYEAMYKSGFAYSFWGGINTAIAIFLGLMGYCVYRFRETRAMTMGQFLEMRYSRKFRIFAGLLQSISGIVNYALFPAVGARFLVYFCGLPVELHFCGLIFPTFAVLMAVFLGLAATVACMGGMVTIMTTDCVQRLLSYPMYVVIVAFILIHFSWFRDLAPALLDRPAGQSMLNPFDISGLRDFNLFYVLVGIISGMVNRMGWSGNQGYTCAARTAHEQKIAGILGTWGSGFSMMMITLVGVVAFAYLNSDKYQEGPDGAAACRTELAAKAMNDVMAGEKYAPVRQDLNAFIQSGAISPNMQAMLDKTAALKAAEEKAARKDEGASEANAAPAPGKSAGEEREAKREIRMTTTRDAIRAVNPSASQTFETIFGQMRVPMALRHLLPIGIMGLFCTLCIMMMFSVDISYQHSWGSILVQDIILPLRGKPLSPVHHLRLLRCMIAFVATFAFFFSLFFGQMDYILMFFAITGAIWLGGSGPCITGGLYWKRGTAAAAWITLIAGSSFAVASILAQKYWVSLIYPWLVDKQLVETVAVWLKTASHPFEPLIKWRMSADKFPINSQELFALNLLLSIVLYIVVSLLTGRHAFNMDRLLHRGKYHREGERVEFQRVTWRTFVPTMLGIDRQYTRGDKILAWSVFLWSFVWGVVISFAGVAIWNLISPWSDHGWSVWFFINNFVFAGVIGVVSTIWFTIGGTIDLRRLFKDLAMRDRNVLDDGRVIGRVSADDVELVEQVDSVVIEEAHIEEKILREELKAEHDQADLDNLDKHTPHGPETPKGP